MTSRTLTGLAFLVPLLYFFHINADSIAGLFGIFWFDEGVYLLAAKNYALFGKAHLFANDMWRPELRTPLLHYYGIATITQADSLTWLRLGMAAQVIAGAALIAAISNHFKLCFLAILLSPVLFFYARTGMAEGQQFFILSLIIATLFKLHSETHMNKALLFACLAGALTGLLFVSKISAIGACIGAAVGIALSIYMNSHMPRKLWLLVSAALAAIAVLYIYFYLFIGNDTADWWRINIEGRQALGQIPLTISTAWNIWNIHRSMLAHYICLMPICAFYLLAPIIASDKNKGFILILAAVTLATLLVETMLGVAMRRVFFSLSLLSILFGFVASDYLQNGVRIKRPSSIQLLALVLWASYLAAMIAIFYRYTLTADKIYILFISAFLGLSLLAILVRSLRARATLLSIAACCSLAPMLYQSFLAPYTRENITAQLEELIPEDAIFAGAAAPWMFQGLKRQTLLTNCMGGFSTVDYGSDMASIPHGAKLYYIKDVSFSSNLNCDLPDARAYKRVAIFNIFSPENFGPFAPGSATWQFNKTFAVYAKP